MPPNHSEEVTLNEPFAAQHGEMLAEISYALAVEFHHPEVAPLDDQVLG